MDAQRCNERPGKGREQVCCGDDLRAHLVVPLFKALADPSRAAILASLADARRPLRVGEIGTCCPQDLSVVSRHLSILRRAGIVESERRGREVWYHLRVEGLVRAMRELADAFESCCTPKRGDE
jgi:ArsR family transcriptional regulator, arsenate/arsenite/antimonite-responsive transcriptional repressor